MVVRALSKVLLRLPLLAPITIWVHRYTLVSVRLVSSRARLPVTPRRRRADSHSVRLKPTISVCIRPRHYNCSETMDCWRTEAYCLRPGLTIFPATPKRSILWHNVFPNHEFVVRVMRDWMSINGRMRHLQPQASRIMRFPITRDVDQLHREAGSLRRSHLRRNHRPHNRLRSGVHQIRSLKRRTRQGLRVSEEIS